MTNLLPDKVLAFQTYRGVIVLHLPDGHRQSGALLPLVEAVNLHRHLWCQTCWPGRRCEICRVPSGTADECDSCWAADEYRHIRLSDR